MHGVYGGWRKGPRGVEENIAWSVGGAVEVAAVKRRGMRRYKVGRGCDDKGD